MEILLNKYELLDLGANPRGLSLTCQAGTCWLTQTGDDRDHILRAGEQFKACEHRHLIVTATEDCRLILTTAPSKNNHGVRWQQLACNN